MLESSTLRSNASVFNTLKWRLKTDAGGAGRVMTLILLSPSPVSPPSRKVFGAQFSKVRVATRGVLILHCDRYHSRGMRSGTATLPDRVFHNTGACTGHVHAAALTSDGSENKCTCAKL